MHSAYFQKPPTAMYLPNRQDLNITTQASSNPRKHRSLWISLSITMSLIHRIKTTAILVSRKCRSSEVHKQLVAQNIKRWVRFRRLERPSDTKSNESQDKLRWSWERWLNQTNSGKMMCSLPATVANFVNMVLILSRLLKGTRRGFLAGQGR